MDLKGILATRLNLDLDAADRLLIFNREGFPYWAIYVVTADGETIKDSVVDRFW